MKIWYCLVARTLLKFALASLYIEQVSSKDFVCDDDRYVLLKSCIEFQNEHKNTSFSSTCKATKLCDTFVAPEPVIGCQSEWGMWCYNPVL